MPSVNISPPFLAACSLVWITAGGLSILALFTDTSHVYCLALLHSVLYLAAFSGFILLKLVISTSASAFTAHAIYSSMKDSGRNRYSAVERVFFRRRMLVFVVQLVDILALLVLIVLKICVPSTHWEYVTLIILSVDHSINFLAIN